MFDYCEKAIDILKSRRVDFGDIRIVEKKEQGLGVKNGRVAAADVSHSLGFGVRALVNGAWGFASSNELTPREVERVTGLAIEIAKASSLLKSKAVRLAPEPAYQDRWVSPFLIDPFQVSLQTKMDLLFAVDKILRKDKRIKSSIAYMDYDHVRKHLATTDGTRIEQVALCTGAGCICSAVENGEIQERSFPAGNGRNMQQVGYEFIDALRMEERADQVREEAIALLSAPQCPEGKMDLIIGGNQLALQIHESAGHASELDRVLGYEESYAGSSFLTTDKYKNGFRYGSPIVNLVADATLPGGLATCGYDDDGVRAQRWHIVKDGMLSGYMTNREFCGEIGLKRANGCNRADGHSSIPITRICNLSLMPGDWEYDDLIASTKNGIIMDNNKSWSIDQKRLNFQFGSEMGWLVKNGKITGMVKNPTYQGITPEFWNSCDAICNHKHWKLQGVVNCGKGQPGQTARMTHASSPARFKNVTVGVKAK